MATTSPNAAGVRVAHLHALAADLAAHRRRPDEERQAHRRNRLAELVAHAASSSPFYRRSLGAAAGGDVVLSELPTLTKETLMEHFDEIVADPRVDLAAAERRLAGDAAGGAAFRAFATSGSSGIRGVIVYTDEEFETWAAASLCELARLGIGPATRLAAIGAPGARHITRELFATFQAGPVDAPRLSVALPLDELVAALDEHPPEVLITYASIAGLLAAEQLEGRLRIRPRLVLTTAEVLTRTALNAIETAWGTEPIQVYAATEAPLIAVSGEPGAALRVPEDLLVVEVVDEENRPVAPGVPGHKVLLTNLVNRAQPLIRYELTDSVVVTADAGDGLGVASIASIDGRSDDVLSFAARGGGAVAVHPFRLRSLLEAVAGVRQYQIEYEGGVLRVRVVLGPDATTGAPQEVGAAVGALLDAVGAAAPEIVVDAVSAIEREPGPAAKVKLVKNLPPGGS